jgi:DNA-binding beta-propeller fold protein YncE
VGAGAFLAISDQSSGGAQHRAAVAPPPAIPSVIHVGGKPSGITIGKGSVWVADDSSNTVTRISERTGQKTGAPIPVGERPQSLTYGNGFVWVASAYDGALTKIDAASGKVVGSPIDVGGAPEYVTFGANYLWVSHFPGKFAQINPTSGARVASTKGSGDHEGAAVHDKDVLFISKNSDGPSNVQHWHTQPSSTFSASIPTGKASYGVTFAGGFGWVSNFVDDTVTKVDLATDRPVGTIRGVPSAQDGDGIAAGFGAIWLAGSYADQLIRLDPATGAISRYSVGRKPVAVAVGESRVWVASRAAGTVTPVKP